MIGDQSGGELRRMTGRWLPTMVVALGFTAFAPACLAQVPVVSNPTPVSFGSQAVGSAQAQTTVTFTVTTGGTLDTAPLALTTGAPNLDYTLGTGSTCTGLVSVTCTVKVVFTPKAPGQRLGAVVLTSGGETVATALLHGTGTGAAVVFPDNPAPIILGSGFNTPGGVAVDAAGNVYVADYGNRLVQEIEAVGGSIPSGPTIRTLGSGFFTPLGVAVDGAGNIYVADLQSNLVYEIVAVGGSIPSSPTIRTLGSGFSFPRGVAVDGEGNVYVSGGNNHAVYELVAVGGSVPATNPTILTLGSGFNDPAGVAVDGAGNVYVADLDNSAVTELVAVGGSVPATNPTILTLGGGFTQPEGVAVDGAGNVYVAVQGNGAVYELVAVGGSIPATNPTILTLASGFNAPAAVAVDGAGNVYVGTIGISEVAEIPLATPPSLSFASTGVGSTSSDSPQTLLLQNIGNANLTFPIPSSGTNPSLSDNYSLSTSSTCPQLTPTTFAEQTLAPGICTAGISFSPTTTGSLPGALVFTDNSLSAGNNATQTIALSGTATIGTPTITFAVPDHTFGAAPFTVSATSNSTGAFTYSVVSGPATISGSTVTLTGAGTVVLKASQAASANFIAGTKNASFTVAAATAAIVFTVPNHTFGDAPFTVSATSNSTGAFTYSVVSGPATISGSTVTLTGAGTVVLKASQAADANFIASTKNASFTVAPGTPTITFAVPNQTFGDAPFTVSATSNSTGAFTYSVVSGPATISGSTVTLTGSGTVVLSASLAASGNFAAATVTTNVTVAIAGFTLGNGSSSSSASTAPGGAASFSLTLSPGTGATILPDAINFSVSGLPPGATATFSPATVAAGSGVTTVTLSIQTSSSQALLRNENPFSGKPIAPVTMGFLLLPLLGLKPLRKRFRKLSRSSVLALTVISLGVMLLGLSGCGAGNAPPKNYTVVVTATDTTANVQHTTSLTLTVQ
jgi:sugar lactone lactonase YvrE